MDSDELGGGAPTLSRRDFLRVMKAAAEAAAAKAAEKPVTAAVKAAAGMEALASAREPATVEDFQSPLAREFLKRDWRDWLLEEYRDAVSRGITLTGYRKLEKLDKLDRSILPEIQDEGELTAHHLRGFFRALGVHPQLEDGFVDEVRRRIRVHKKGTTALVNECAAINAEILHTLAENWLKLGLKPDEHANLVSMRYYLHDLTHGNLGLASDVSEAEKAAAKRMQELTSIPSRREITKGALRELRQLTASIARQAFKTITTDGSYYRVANPEPVRPREAGGGRRDAAKPKTRPVEGWRGIPSNVRLIDSLDLSSIGDEEDPLVEAARHERLRQQSLAPRRKRVKH